MKIYGLAGTNGSGKDTIALLLRDKYGFCFADATKMLTDELIKRGEPTDRVNKADMSAKWRREFGMAVIVDKGVELFKAGDYKGLVVGSLRHPGEVDRVHELGGEVIWADADPKVRYGRISRIDRGRTVEDDKSFEDFMADEEREMHPVGDGATLNVAAVKAKADIFITNDGDDLDNFKHMAEDALGLV